MAGASLLALLDDITTILDDVATMTKVAAKKTAGVLGDDLALNAQQVSEVRADRELPVVWAVAKGSFLNKAILVPAALLLSSFLPWLITPLLMVGGAYLCFEGAEKLFHWLSHLRHGKARVKDTRHTHSDPVNGITEKQRISGAIRTDFILSAEIIIISLGALEESTLPVRVISLIIIAFFMTIAVYGLVAGIVKLDDFGLYLVSKPDHTNINRLFRNLGRLILSGAPYLTRTLSFVGTAAMFLVGGGIIMHGIHPVGDLAESLIRDAAALPSAGPALELLLPSLLGAAFGAVSGSVVLVAVLLFRRFFPARGMH